MCYLLKYTLQFVIIALVMSFISKKEVISYEVLTVAAVSTVCMFGLDRCGLNKKEYYVSGAMKSLVMYGWTPNIQKFENYINQYNTVKFDDKALPNGKSYSQVLQEYLTYIKTNMSDVYNRTKAAKDMYNNVLQYKQDRINYLIELMQTNLDYCIQNCGTDTNCKKNCDVKIFNVPGIGLLTIEKMKGELDVLKKGEEVMKDFH